MAFDFPAAPVVDDEYTIGGINYIWTGNSWDIKGGGDPQDYVLRAGDIMIGTGALAFNLATFNISATLNFDYNAPTGAFHKFYVNAVEKLSIGGSGIGLNANTSVTGWVVSTGTGSGFYSNKVDSANGEFMVFNGRTSDNRSCFQLKAFKNGYNAGNNEGGLRCAVGVGGWGFQNVFETTIASPPGFKVFGTLQGGSYILLPTGTGNGLRIGDNWHGWEWTSTYNGEVLKSYQGKFGFHKTNGSVPGTLQFQIDDAGGTAHMSMSANRFVDRSLLGSPGLEAFTEEEDADLPRRGINLGKLLLHALAEIKTLKAEVATLKARKK